MTLKKTVYSSLSIFFAVMVLFAGMVAWFYIGKFLWHIAQVALG